MENSDIKEELVSIKDELADIRKEILYSVAPKFLEISVEVNDLAELAIDYWRLENRMNKILDTLKGSQKENLENSISRIKRYLEKNDIEIVDHTNQKYDEGQNLEILMVEEDPKIKEPIVKETKEPTILHKGQIIHIGKVILVNNKGIDSDE